MHIFAIRKIEWVLVFYVVTELSYPFLVLLMMILLVYLRRQFLCGVPTCWPQCQCGVHLPPCRSCSLISFSSPNSETVPPENFMVAGSSKHGYVAVSVR